MGRQDTIRDGIKQSVTEVMPDFQGTLEEMKNVDVNSLPEDQRELFKATLQRLEKTLAKTNQLVIKTGKLNEDLKIIHIED